MLLSTHIVADVSDLCPRMAILNAGRLVATGNPTELAGALRGRLWRRLVDKNDLEEHQKRYTVLATRRAEGRIAIHVHSEIPPGPGFDPIEPDLEDAYFWAIRGAGPPPRPRPPRARRARRRTRRVPRRPGAPRPMRAAASTSIASSSRRSR